jgi:hypothetical protein
MRAETVAIAAVGTGARIFWLDRENAVWSAEVGAGAPLAAVRAIGLGATSRVPLHASAIGDGFDLVVHGATGPTVARLGADGSLRSTRALTTSSPPWTWAAAIAGDSGSVAWSDRVAGPSPPDDVVWIERGDGPPREVLVSENALLAFFGTPLLERGDVAHLAISTITETVVARVGARVETIGLGPDHGSLPVLVDTPDGVLVIAGGGSGTGSRTSLGAARIPEGSTTATPWQALDAACTIESYVGASRATADAVAWVQYCGGVRELAISVCSRRRP